MRNRLSLTLLLAFMLTCIGNLVHAAPLPDGWESRETKLPSLLYSVSFANENVGWACGINTIINTTDGGTTWQQQWKGTYAGPDSYWFNSIVALTPKVAVACAFSYARAGAGVVLRTQDGGATWAPVKVGDNGEASFCSLAFRNDHTTGYLISNRDGLFVTHDAGASWSAVNLPVYIARVMLATRGNISLPDDHTICIGGDRKLLRSTDDGNSWETLPLPDGVTNPHNQFFWVTFATPEHGWVQLLGGDTLETSDGGQSWKKSSLTGRVIFRDTKCGWAINDYDISATTDGGATWTPATTISSGKAKLVAMAFTKDRLFIVGGDEGTGTQFVCDHASPATK